MRINKSRGDWYLLENKRARILLKNGEIGAVDKLHIRSYYKGYLSRLYENSTI